MQTHRTTLPRLAMLAVLLAGLGGIAVLTQLSVRAHKLQQQTARSLIGGLATRVADRYSTDLQGQIYIAGTALFSRAGTAQADGKARRETAAAILAAVPAVMRCQCASILHPVYAFSANLRDSTLATVAADSTVPVQPPPLSLLREELAMREMAGGWEFAVALRLAPGGRVLFFTRIPGDRNAIAGFALDTAEVRYRLLHEVDSRRGAILAAAGLAAADSQTLALQFTLADSTPLAVLGAAHPGTIPGSTTLPRVFGGWRITAGLTEAMAAGTVGAVTARSPLTLMLVLAGLAAIALLIGWAAARRAAELAAVRASLITSMSHELRTPLTEILLVGESIQRGRYREPSELAGAVDVVVREAHRLLTMISNVLQISVTGAPAARRTSVLLIGDEVRRVIDDFRAIAAGYHCTIELRIVNDLPVAVDLDAVRQILNNFLDNACRHGGPDRQVMVVLRHIEGAMRLEVHDSGPGIAAALREAVWQPFFRAAAPEGREVSGSGIGLAVARQLATSMQGRTGIDSAPEGGAVVFLELPVAGVA